MEIAEKKYDQFSVLGFVTLGFTLFGLLLFEFSWNYLLAIACIILTAITVYSFAVVHGIVIASGRKEYFYSFLTFVSLITLMAEVLLLFVTLTL